MKNILSMYCMLSCFVAKGQVFQKVFKTIAPAGFDCNTVFKTTDGGYIISGNKGYYQGSVDAALIKIDSVGDYVWSKVYESVSGYTYGRSMIQDGDSAYIIAGQNSAGDRLTLIKINSDGDIMWSTVYEDPAFDIVPNKIQKTSDGNFILLFRRLSGGIGDAGMMKFDGAGNILWSRLYLETFDADFIELENGDIIIASLLHSVSQPFHPVLIKTDANGNFLWRKAYNFPNSIGSPFPICKTGDNGILMAPGSDSTIGGNVINALVKLDSAGNVLWSNNYLGSGYAEIIKLVTNGGFFIGSIKNDSITYDYDILVYRVDSTGTPEMSKIYGDDFHRESAQDFVTDSDNGYIMISNRDTVFGVTPTGNILIVKANSTGYSGCNETPNSITKTAYTTTSWNLSLVEDTLAVTPDTITFNITTDGNMGTLCVTDGIEEEYFKSLEIYPNPTTGLFKLEFNGTVQKIQIFNMLGEIVLQEEATGKNEIQIDLSKNPPGIYFVRISSGEKIFSRKVIKQ